MKRTLAWSTLAFFAATIAAYGIAFVLIGEKMHPPPLADSFRMRPWGINPHALFGSIALLTGAAQFNRRTLRRRRVHRVLGTIYLAACAVTGLAGLYLAWYSFGGMVTHLGFGLLAAALLFTTAMAFVKIRVHRDVGAHREWMIRSYCLIFAAVMLRIELPLLIAYFRAFEPAYLVVAWLCWVPNLAFAEGLIRTSRRREAPFVASLASSRA